MLLYFLPEVKALTPEVLERHGLTHLDSRTSRETYRGPGGQSGLLVGESTTPAELLSYHETQQTWSPRFGLDSLVGHWHQHPVTPAILARTNQIAGPSVTLLDGHAWQIPQLRQWRAGDDSLVVNSKLPCVMQQSPSNGRFILGAVVPQYRQLWESSLEIAQHLLSQLSAGTVAELDDDRVNHFVIDLLAVNYRIDASIVSHLQLLTPGHCGEIVCAALDLDTLRNSLKNLYSRRTSGGTNTGSGEPRQTAG